MIPINYTEARRLAAKGNELELSVYAMTKTTDIDSTIANRRDSIDHYDVILMDREEGDVVMEFEDISDELSAAISNDIEGSLNLVACYVGP